MADATRVGARIATPPAAVVLSRILVLTVGDGEPLTAAGLRVEDVRHDL